MKSFAKMQIIGKNQTKILELKNTVSEMKSAMESTRGRMDTAEENP